jgi:LysM repeat protein
MGIKYMKHLKLIVFLCVLTFAVSCGQQKKYIEYKVKEGETMRLIAGNLNMRTRDLLRLNPDVGRRPSANTVIIIPNKKMANTSDEEGIKSDTKGAAKEKKIKEAQNILLEELKKAFVVHLVKPKETIYGLKRFYNVSEKELFDLNPVLTEGLKIGQILKIKPILESKGNGDVKESELEATVMNAIYEDIIAENTALKVALLLPFKAGEFDYSSSKEIFGSSQLANIVTDFYLGTEIAIDSLRNQGIKIELNVFDTRAKGSRIETIASSSDFHRNHVIIGPLYSEEAELLASKVSIPIVFPHYSRKQSRFISPQLIKTAPEKKVFREELVRYIKDNFNSGNLILVGDGKKSSNAINLSIKESLEAQDSISKVHILVPEKGYIKKEKFLAILKPNVKNWVVLTTNKNDKVADAINSLISLPESTTVKTFTIDKGKVYDRIANLKLGKIGFTYVSDEYVDEKSPSTQIFNKQYFRKNNALPSYYATKGFDITYDVLLRLASGNSLNDSFSKGASFRVETKFDYKCELNKTTENNGLFILQYNNDLSLTRLK